LLLHSRRQAAALRDAARRIEPARRHLGAPRGQRSRLGSAAAGEVIRRLLLVFLLTRAIAIGATHLGAALMTPDKRAQWEWIPDRDNLFPGPGPSPFLAPLVRWDANFYVSLTRDGYPPRHPGANHHLAFFPLYPLLLRAIPIDVFWAAFILSNLCAWIAAFCVLRLAGFE